MKFKNLLTGTVIILLCLLTNLLYSQTRFKSLNYVYSISGSRIISGQHNDQKDGTGVTTYTNRVFNITGKYPALWSGDFLFHGNSQMRWDVTYEAERQWNAGAIVNIMWHACPPNQNAVCNWDGGLLSHLSDAQWNDLITNGGYLNGIWKQRIDEIAVYLQYLEDKGVEVFWRPLHEMNQGAFWWGGRTGPNGSRRLYQITRDYMENVKGLTNLIWIWDVQDLSTNYADYNPGSNYWDIGALDIYGDAYTNSSYYNALVGQAGTKPIAIGECGTLPGANIMTSQPRWTFFMNWAYLLQQNNTDQYIRDVYNDPRVITRDEMPGWNNVGGSCSGTAISLPGTVQAENYCEMSGVQTETTTDSGGGLNVGWIDTGDWMAYRVNIPTSGTYTVQYRVASQNGGGSIRLERQGGGTFGTIAVPSTGGWQTWTTISHTVQLTAGIQNIAIAAAAGGFNINWIGFSGGGGAINLAYNRPVTTTSNENTTNTGPKAVDANGTTRWSSAYANNQNFIVDLGANYNISRIRIAWEAAYARDYQIQISTNNSTWTNIREVWGKSSSAADDFTGLSGTARWVKVYCINRATAYGFSFFELEVYGTAAARMATNREIDRTVEAHDEIVTVFPNPASDKTVVVLNLPEDAQTEIAVHGILGEKMASIHNGFLNAGYHQFNVDTNRFSSGLYTYTVIYNGKRITRKMVVKH